MVQSECDNHLGRLVVHGKTWDRDSHGLFDYECNKITAATIKTNTSGVLVRVCKNARPNRGNRQPAYFLRLEGSI